MLMPTQTQEPVETQVSPDGHVPSHSGAVALPHAGGPEGSVVVVVLVVVVVVGSSVVVVGAAVVVVVAGPCCA
jgi:hypothetical protein